jgi:hypothetical protein
MGERGMVYQVLADLVVALHFAFVLFSVFGAFLIFKWKRCAWIHIPCVAWAGLIELAGWVCPLTPLENWLRGKSGIGGYGSGFIEHYVLPVLYPAALTRELQITLGVSVLAVNLVIYGWLFYCTVKPKA